MKEKHNTIRRSSEQIISIFAPSMAKTTKFSYSL